MDGFPVKRGDHVYDLLTGGGSVTYADGTQIRVKFGAGGERVYSARGYIGDIRRLYWADPILEVPPKNDQYRVMLQDIIRVVRQNVKK